METSQSKKSARDTALSDMQAAGIDINSFLMYELLISKTERCEYLESLVDTKK